MTETGKTSFKIEALEILSGLTSKGQSRLLQETTIVEAAISRVFFGGYDRKRFWQNPSVSARSTFMKWRKYDKRFVSIFDEVCQLAQTWRTSLAADSVEEALTVLQLHAPEAARKTVDLMRWGSHFDAQQRMAAKDILDRAGKETADKSAGTAVPIPNLDEVLKRIYGEDEPSES